MLKKHAFFFSIFFVLILFSCHKKMFPVHTTEENGMNNSILAEKKSDSLALVKTSDSLSLLKKPVVKRKPKIPIPTVITVNDNVARKSVDGRLYYDLQGHRYWRSNKDGKYYIFSKSMQSDPAFQKPR